MLSTASDARKMLGSVWRMWGREKWLCR